MGRIWDRIGRDEHTKTLKHLKIGPTLQICTRTHVKSSRSISTPALIREKSWFFVYLARKPSLLADRRMNLHLQTAENQGAATATALHRAIVEELCVTPVN